MFDKAISESDKRFANEVSDFVNGKMDSAINTGRELAKDHRYLVNIKFKMAMAFIEQLDHDFKDGNYDARNEYACHLAHETIESLKEKELYYSTL